MTPDGQATSLDGGWRCRRNTHSIARRDSKRVGNKPGRVAGNVDEGKETTEAVDNCLRRSVSFSSAEAVF
ncbi:hypothetical protein PAXINDRAFT_20108 [Paxillus involutus ATCC 200175]|uniref:Uncharacterized protein n=1 Tax=Paxillus involutus ATCC 200175 TaxID=664439 RepID=A0A0C9SVN6_PAXIN|nr:hypothetical protein PAXINDRAFT_20108 [Paxillus involutus ATCC 200175]